MVTQIVDNDYTLTIDDQIKFNSIVENRDKQVFLFIEKLYLTKKYKQIIAFWPQIQKIQNIQRDINIFLSLAYFNLGHFDIAKQYLVKLIEHRFAFICKYLIKLGDLGLIEDYKFCINEVIISHPYRQESWYDFGVTLIHNLIPAAANTTLIQSQTIQSNDLTSLYLAYSYIYIGQIDKAEKLLFPLLHNNQLQFEAFIMHAIVKFKNGRKAIARQLFESCKRVNSSSYFFHWLMVKLSDLLGYNQEMILYSKRCIEYRPHLIYIRKLLINQLIKANKHSAAICAIEELVILKPDIEYLEKLFSFYGKYRLQARAIKFYERNKLLMLSSDLIKRKLIEFYAADNNIPLAKLMLNNFKKHNNDYYANLFTESVVATYDKDYEHSYKCFCKLFADENNLQKYFLSGAYRYLIKTNNVDHGIQAYTRQLSFIQDERLKIQLKIGILWLYMHKGAFDKADEIFIQNPNCYNTEFLSLKYLMAYRYKNKIQYHQLCDFNQITEIKSIQKQLLIGIDNLNQGILSFLDDYKNISFEPSRNATRSGWHTDILDNTDNKYMKLFITTIQKIIRQFINSKVVLLADNHPLKKTMPQKFVVMPWAVIMKKGGHQLPHIHTSGWLSGVYYLKVPKAITIKNLAGWLELGPANDLLENIAFKPKMIKPSEGKLVLFPSYIWHRTIPLECNEKRVSLAFDIIAVD